MHINKKIFILLCLLLPTTFIKAETHVYPDDIQQNWVWNKEGSPYILEDYIHIPNGYELHINEGVEVSSALNEYAETYSITVNGSLTVSGATSSPVTFTDLNTVYFIDSVSDIKHASFINSGMDFLKSTSTIQSVSVKDSFYGVNARASVIKITDSSLYENGYGISSFENEEQGYQVRNMTNIGGIGNAEFTLGDGMVVDSEQNIIQIKNSSIYDNANLNIINQTRNTIDATDNWWGNAEDPSSTISGLVHTVPWKTEAPSVKESCCSSVVFIPGLQATRIYKDTNLLWEPNRNADVEKMSMNTNGESIDASIHKGDIVKYAYGIKDVYGSFVSSMDTLVTGGHIKEWKSLPYDWRYGVYDLVDEDMLSQIYTTASSSKTGKVTIVAHSNGGLVAKAMMKKLEDAGDSAIVDRLIMVAVPELGTPQSILSMLHGQGQEISGGLVLSENTARKFSQNMPSAYGLLPSQKFYERNPLTVISNMFSKNSVANTYTAVKDFLLSNPFSLASSTDTSVPLILNPLLFNKNDIFHKAIDIWKSASTTKTLSIFGWGVPTSKTVNYERDAHCKERRDKCDVSMFRTVTSAGDGTVMTIAGSGESDETVFLNLKKIKEDTKKDIKHADILKSPQLQEMIKDTIIGDSSNQSNQNEDYKKYFTETEPVDQDKWLYVRVYSPVDIHVYDKEGNHTGIIENPIEGVDLENYEDNIPGSVYDGWGRTKQVILPYGGEYQILLDGTDNGIFSVHAEVRDDVGVISSTTFSDLPVTSDMNAEFAIATSTEFFATSTVMYIDEDGDGTTETLHNSDEFLRENKKDRKHFKKFKKVIKKMIKKKLSRIRNR